MIYRVKKEIVKTLGLSTIHEREVVLSTDIDYMEFNRELEISHEYHTSGCIGYGIPDQCYMKIVPLEKL